MFTLAFDLIVDLRVRMGFVALKQHEIVKGQSFTPA